MRHLKKRIRQSSELARYVFIFTLIRTNDLKFLIIKQMEMNNRFMQLIRDKVDRYIEAMNEHIADSREEFMDQHREQTKKAISEVRFEIT